MSNNRFHKDSGQKEALTCEQERWAWPLRRHAIGCGLRSPLGRKEQETSVGI